MVQSLETILGVVNGSKPFYVLLPRFERLTAGQVNPIAGQANAVTVTLQPNVNILGENGDAFTITNLVGAEDVTEVTSDRLCSDLWGWDQANSSLTLPLCGEFLARNEFTFTFQFRNGPEGQKSPALTLQVDGFVIVEQIVGMPSMQLGVESRLLGVQNGSDALTIVVPALTTISMEQTVPIVKQENQVLITLETNVNLLGSAAGTINGLSVISISGFSGAKGLAGTVTLLPVTDGNGGEVLFCSDDPRTEPGGKWSGNTLTLSLCRDKTLEAN
eukprot:3927330-Rhodomonas_salina.1